MKAITVEVLGCEGLVRKRGNSYIAIALHNNKKDKALCPTLGIAVEFILQYRTGSSYAFMRERSRTLDH